MNRNNLLQLLALVSLSTSVGCNGVFAGDDISGTWEGEFEVEGETLDVSFELESDGDNEYSGSGETEWYCLIDAGEYTYWDNCTMEFDIYAETEGGRGEQEISFELEDCTLEWKSDSVSTDCPDDFDLDWDGDDTMDGDVDDDIEMEIERQ